MKVTPVAVTYNLPDGTEQTDNVFARNLRYSNAMRLMGILMAGAKRKEIVDENGETQTTMDLGDASFENRAKYNLELIAQRLCDADGKKLFDVEGVDAWSDDDGGSVKIVAYAKALDVKTKTTEEVAGN